MKRRLFIILVIVVVVAIGGWWWFRSRNTAPRESTTVSSGTIARTVSKECAVDFSDQVTSTAQVSGEVVSVAVESGQPVKKDQLIITLSNPDLKNARQSAEASLEQAKLQRDLSAGSSRKIADQSVTIAEKQLEQAKRNESRLKVTTPIAGTLAKVFVNQGQFVSVGTPLLAVINYGTAKIVCNLSDIEYADIQRAQTAQSFVASVEQDGKTYALTSKALLAFPQAEQVTYQLELNPAQDFPTKLLQLGFTVSVDVQTDRHDNVLLIPLKFLGADQKGEFVTVKNQAGKFEHQYLTTGLTDGNQIEIMDGLSAGDSIYLSTP